LVKFGLILFIDELIAISISIFINKIERLEIMATLSISVLRLTSVSIGRWTSFNRIKPFLRLEKPINWLILLHLLDT